jgi:hypothetical protein
MVRQLIGAGVISAGQRLHDIKRRILCRLVGGPGHGEVMSHARNEAPVNICPRPLPRFEL